MYIWIKKQHFTAAVFDKIVYWGLTTQEFKKMLSNVSNLARNTSHKKGENQKCDRLMKEQTEAYVCVAMPVKNDGVQSALKLAGIICSKISYTRSVSLWNNAVTKPIDIAKLDFAAVFKFLQLAIENGLVFDLNSNGKIDDNGDSDNDDETCIDEMIKSIENVLIKVPWCDDFEIKVVDVGCIKIIEWDENDVDVGDALDEKDSDGHFYDFLPKYESQTADGETKINNSIRQLLAIGVRNRKQFTKSQRDLKNPVRGAPKVPLIQIGFEEPQRPLLPVEVPARKFGRAMADKIRSVKHSKIHGDVAGNIFLFQSNAKLCKRMPKCVPLYFTETLEDPAVFINKYRDMVFYMQTSKGFKYVRTSSTHASQNRERHLKIAAHWNGKAIVVCHLEIEIAKEGEVEDDSDGEKGKLKLIQSHTNTHTHYSHRFLVRAKKAAKPKKPRTPKPEAAATAATKAR